MKTLPESGVKCEEDIRSRRTTLTSLEEQHLSKLQPVETHGPQFDVLAKLLRWQAILAKLVLARLIGPGFSAAEMADHVIC